MFVHNVDTWHGIHLYAIVIYAGWPIIYIKIQLKRAEHDVMHQNVCIDDALKRSEMRNSNVSVDYMVLRENKNISQIQSIRIESHSVKWFFKFGKLMKCNHDHFNR